MQIAIHWVKRLFSAILLGIIRGYRYLISPLLPPSCRFSPTCSCYAAEAIEVHGSLKGLFLALGRILRCHPFCQGGYDPVPPVKCQSCTQDHDGSSKENTTNKTPQCRTQSGSIIL